MKMIAKILTIFLSVMITSLLCINALADSDNSNKDTEIDTSVAYIINSQLSDEEIDLFNDCGNSELSIDEQKRSKYPILGVYDDPFYYDTFAGEPLDTLLSYAKTDKAKLNHARYIVFDTTPYIVGTFDNGEKITVSVNKTYQNSKIPTYISDIMALTKELSITEKCTLEGVFCFNGETSHRGIAVYLKTDIGVYVKYYKNSSTEAVLFAEKEFRIKATEYNDYLKSYENNYNENGEPIGGATLDFLSFISEAENDETKEPESSEMNGAEKDTASTGCKSALSGSAAIITPIIMAISLMATKRKRRKKDR